MALLALAAAAGPALAADMPVVGGSSFNDAAPLTRGTFDDALGTGSTLFYRVRLARGERLTVAAAVNVGALDPSVTGSSTLTLRLYGPLRNQETEAQAVGPGDTATHLKTTSADVGPVSDAGGYYVSVALNDFLPAGGAAVPLPLVLHVGVDPMASRPRVTARAAKSAGGTTWPVFAAFCAGGVLFGAVGGLLFRRR